MWATQTPCLADRPRVRHLRQALRHNHQWQARYRPLQHTRPHRPRHGSADRPCCDHHGGDQPISITDLALQPGTNTLYGTSLSEDDFINSIYTIYPATGVATLIGRTGVIGTTLAFGPDGTLYQYSAIFDDVGFVAGYLNTLDPDTGAVLTTSDPYTEAHVGGLAVRPTDGVIFASGGDQGDIYTLSPTGTQTFVGFTSVGGIGDLAFTPLPTSKADCKNGGWQRFSFPYSFKNQGDCIQFVNTGK